MRGARRLGAAGARGAHPPLRARAAARLAEKARQARFLQYRGFSNDHIRCGSRAMTARLMRHDATRAGTTLLDDDVA